MKEKEFDVNSKIHVPKVLIKKKFDDYYIILAPDYPKWIVLNGIEYLLFNCLESGKTILDSMDYIIEKYYNLITEDCVINSMTSLLSKIEETKFYYNSGVKEALTIDKIKKGIHISLTNNCNIRCTHCYMSAGLEREVKLNCDKIVSFVNQVNEEIGYTNLVISGGEPLVYPNVLELMEKLSKNNITLFTNGTLINQHNYNSICTNCKKIQISFEGFTKEVYEKVRGKGNFDKVLAAIELIKKSNVRLALAITLLPNNIENIEENLVKFVKELNYDNIEIKLNSDIELKGNALNMDFTGYDKVYADRLILKLMKELNDVGISIEYKTGQNKRFGNCGIGTNLVINYDGSVYPCSKFTDIKMNINDSVKDIISYFDELNQKSMIFDIEKCQVCELKYICAGGCRIENYIKNGSFCTPSCDDSFKESHYRRMISEYLRGS